MSRGSIIQGHGPHAAGRHRCGAKLLLVATLLGCSQAQRDHAETRPDVLLVVIDTLRQDHLGFAGNRRATSAHLDRLAAESIVYTRAYSQAPWTTPSIGSLLSSRYPSVLGIKDMRSALSEELVLLPEILADAGYRTGAVVSHSFCSAEWNFDQGFEFFNQDNVLGHAGISSKAVTDEALRFLDQDDGRPFFLWTHYFDPHYDYLEHAGFEFEGAYDGPVRSGMGFRRLRGMTEELKPRDLREMRRLYDSEIAFTDHHLGRLLAGLEERGLDRNTLIVFTADHGEEFKDHGLLGHAHTLYGELIHVPLLIRYPERIAREVDQPVGLIDVLPTIVDALGLSLDTPVDGRSLFPPHEAPAPGRVVFSETGRKARLAAATGEMRKLILDLDADPALPGRFEAFDLLTDPEERRPLPAESLRDDPLLVALRKALEDWVVELARESGEAPRLELDAEVRANLEALGYLGEDESN